MDVTTTQHVSIYRPGNESWLREELAAAFPTTFPFRPIHGEEHPGSGQGWIAWQAGRPATGISRTSREMETQDGLIFEQQRLSGAKWIPAEEPVGLAGATLAWLAPQFAGGPRIRDCHVFAVDMQGKATLGGAAAAFQHKLALEWQGSALGLLPAWNKMAAGASEDGGNSKFDAQSTVVQCFLAKGGLWCAVSPPEKLASPFPGGISPLRQPDGAPSRSALKLEESWLLSGQQPTLRDTVIDLGAAPGGWSHACLKRGCRVMAVDNGPLRLGDVEDLPGTLTHMRSDGLRFRPPARWLPVEWLLADMLIPPGVCLGLLRKWIGNRWMRRFVVNLKLPQREPLTALHPVREYLAGVPDLQWRMRQLYHDRREVTVMGALLGNITPPATANSTTNYTAKSTADSRRGTSRPKRPNPSGGSGGRSRAKSQRGKLRKTKT